MVEGMPVAIDGESTNIVAGGDRCSPQARSSRGTTDMAQRKLSYFVGYGYTALMVAAVTAFATILVHVLALGNIALLFLLPVMASASLFGLRTGLFAGVLSSLAYNFFFLPPTGTLHVTNPENAISLIVLLGVATVTSQLSARVRLQADLAATSARSNAALVKYLREITALNDVVEIGRAACAEIARLLNVRVVLIEQSAAGIAIQAASDAGIELETIALAAARWASDSGLPAGHGTATLTASDWQFLPMRAGGCVIGVIGLEWKGAGPLIRPDQLAMLEGLIEQTSLALESFRLKTEMRDVEAVRERDRLRSALLSSVGHDLRTPLTSVVAAAAELRRHQTLPHQDPHIEAIASEAMRLNRFVANLLDITRVEAGALKLHVEAVDLTDAVAAAVYDSRRSHEGRAIQLEVAPDLPLVNVDPQLFHHCLLNLIENAGRYGNPGSPITIQAKRTFDALLLSVLDHGPGLPPGREREIFEAFYRIEGRHRSVSGTGLGLAIVKGFAEAMGMTVNASNRTDRQGARFEIHCPESLLVRAMDQEL